MYRVTGCQYTQRRTLKVRKEDNEEHAKFTITPRANTDTGEKHLDVHICVANTA